MCRAFVWQFSQLSPLVANTHPCYPPHLPTPPTTSEPPPFKCQHILVRSFCPSCFFTRKVSPLPCRFGCCSARLPSPCTFSHAGLLHLCRVCASEQVYTYLFTECHHPAAAPPFESTLSTDNVQYLILLFVFVPFFWASTCTPCIFAPSLRIMTAVRPSTPVHTKRGRHPSKTNSARVGFFSDCLQEKKSPFPTLSFLLLLLLIFFFFFFSSSHLFYLVAKRGKSPLTFLSAPSAGFRVCFWREGGLLSVLVQFKCSRLPL